MPQFTTISPTHVVGKKEYAWHNFLKGGYVAIGWLGEHDLTNKSIDETEGLIKSKNYDNEQSAIESFRKFFALNVGDYVAVNNVNKGLFGVGQITSGYKYKLNKHDTGKSDELYSHYREVKWIIKDYLPRTSLIAEGETAWVPYGTVGRLDHDVPPYILRLVNPNAATKTQEIEFIRPDLLKSVIESIETLRQDQQHQERAHESLVEDFLVAIGYQKHKDIKYRQGRIDVTLQFEGQSIAVVEVKRSWDLSWQGNMDAVKQAYSYANGVGIRYVILTNGDTYIIFDRLKGLSWETNLLGEFKLTSLQEDDQLLINRLRPSALSSTDLNELFRHLSESFPKRK
jgi:predicted Mrr-cat superfamily restriction endonuclease